VRHRRASGIRHQASGVTGERIDDGLTRPDQVERVGGVRVSRQKIGLEGLDLMTGVAWQFIRF